MHAKHAPSRSASVLCAAIAAAAMAGCHDATPPPRWASGGAPLVLPNARWIFEDATVELRPDGKVLRDDDLVFVVDRVGRVTNDDYEPLALLMPDGSVVGTDDQDFGRIGRTNGAPPRSETAWFSIQPNGRVVFFDTEGDRHEAGRWSGCEGPTVRTCALVSHMFFIRSAQRRPRSGIGLGFGMGFWR